MQSCTRIALTLLMPLLASCAAQPTRPATANGGFDALYAEIERSAERYEAAQEQIRHGDAGSGRVEREAALATLNEAAETCAAAPGCESARFIQAYRALLTTSHDLAPDAGLGEGVGSLPAVIDEASPVLADVPEAARAVNLLNGRDLREFITVNTAVKAALNEWLTWMRPLLLDTWENYQFMRHRMWPEYERAGLPEALLFGIMAKESGGRVHAVSRAGASGPLQFMPATGRRFGLGRREDGFDTRFDPQLATRANVMYLNERFAEFNTDLAMSLAAYNGGEGRLGRLHRQTGGKGFWSSAVQSQLPDETRDYVPMVLAAAWLFLHADEYGLAFPDYAVRPGTLTLEQPSSLNGLAICLGGEGTRNGWFRTLRNLNPHLDPAKPLPPGQALDAPEALIAAYRAHCVDGPRLALASDIAKARAALPTRVASATAPAGGGSYTVRKGDSLASISRARGCPSPQVLARANGISAPKYLIRPGQRLSLEGCRG